MMPSREFTNGNGFADVRVRNVPLFWAELRREMDSCHPEILSK